MKVIILLTILAVIANSQIYQTKLEELIFADDDSKCTPDNTCNGAYQTCCGVTLLTNEKGCKTGGYCLAQCPPNTERYQQPGKYGKVYCYPKEDIFMSLVEDIPEDPSVTTPTYGGSLEELIFADDDSKCTPDNTCNGAYQQCCGATLLTNDKGCKTGGYCVAQCPPNTDRVKQPGKYGKVYCYPRSSLEELVFADDDSKCTPHNTCNGAYQTCCGVTLLTNEKGCKTGGYCLAQCPPNTERYQQPGKYGKVYCYPKEDIFMSLVEDIPEDPSVTTPTYGGSLEELIFADDDSKCTPHNTCNGAYQQCCGATLLTNDKGCKTGGYCVAQCPPNSERYQQPGKYGKVYCYPK